MQKKIVILSNNDITSNVIFGKILKNNPNSVSALFFDSKVTKNKSNRILGGLDLLKKMSILYWVYLVYMALIYKFSYYFQFINKKKSNLAYICKEENVELDYIDDYSSHSFISRLRDIAPDIIIVRCSQILSKELIDLVDGEVYCVHSSLLPKFKGIAAEFHCMRKSENYIGTSIFKVEEKLDEGSVICSVKREVDKSKSVFFHMLKNNEHAASMLFDFVNYGIVELESVEDSPSYYSWPKHEQVVELKRKGIRIISFNEVVNLLRFCLLGHEIWK